MPRRYKAPPRPKTEKVHGRVMKVEKEVGARAGGKARRRVKSRKQRMKEELDFMRD